MGIFKGDWRLVRVEPQAFTSTITRNFIDLVIVDYYPGWLMRFLGSQPTEYRYGYIRGMSAFYDLGTNLEVEERILKGRLASYLISWNEVATTTKLTLRGSYEKS